MWIYPDRDGDSGNALVAGVVTGAFHLTRLMTSTLRLHQKIRPFFTPRGLLEVNETSITKNATLDLSVSSLGDTSDRNMSGDDIYLAKFGHKCKSGVSQAVSLRRSTAIIGLC
jgi:hypothetical protein